jgi:hypothetical protein
MKKFLGLAAVALALVAGSTAVLTVHPQAAFACTTWPPSLRPVLLGFGNSGHA